MSCSVTKLCPTLCRPCGLQYARILGPSLSPGVCSGSCPLSQWCYLTSYTLPPTSPFASVSPSIRVFFNKSALHIRWPKYWSFSFSISPSNEYSGLISFRTDLFDLFVVQGTLKSLLSTTIRKHQFFSTQPSLWSNSHINTQIQSKL